MLFNVLTTMQRLIILICLVEIDVNSHITIPSQSLYVFIPSILECRGTITYYKLPQNIILAELYLYISDIY